MSPSQQVQKTDAQERRLNVRKKAYLPIRLYPHTRAMVMDTLTKDISLEGIRCISQTFTPPKTTFRVEFTLPNGNQDVLTVQGQQVWAKQIPDSDQYELGIAFMDVPRPIRQQIVSLLTEIA